MEFWRRTAGRSGPERTINEEIKNIMGAKHEIVGDIRTAQLTYVIWARIIKIVYKKNWNWTSQRRRKRGRPHGEIGTSGDKISEIFVSITPKSR